MLRNTITLLCALLLVGMLSCSGSPTQPSQVVNTGDAPGADLLSSVNSGSSSGGRYTWGYWDVRWDPATHEIEAVPVRESSIHLNILRFLEQTSCQTCLLFGANSFNPDGDLELEITVIHPFDEDPTNYKKEVFTGFDVRGIVVFGGTKVFDENGLIASNYYNDEYTLVEPDGYSRLWSPSAYPPDPDGRPIFQYQQGKFAYEDLDLTTTLNPYMSFDTLSERRTFQAGEQDTVTYTIRFPATPTPLEFGYIIDASWAAPANMDDPVVPDGFPPQANSTEAYRIRNTFDGEITPLGGEVTMSIKVYDWQGSDTIDTVEVEAPDLFNGLITATLENVAALYTEFTATITNELGAPLGTYPVLVSVSDVNAVPIVGQLDAYYIFDLEVTPPLNLELTVELDNYPVEAIFNTQNNTCYFGPVPLTGDLAIMGINSSNDVVDGFPPKFPTGGTGMCIAHNEMYMATDNGAETWTDDVIVYNLLNKTIKHKISIPTEVPGNLASQPLDFIVYENAGEVWTSLYLDDQVGVFFAGMSNPAITRIDTGSGPTTLAIDPSSYDIFVACDGNDTISIISGYSQVVTDTIALETPMESADPLVPATPGMCVNPNTNMLYVATLLYGSVDVYNLDTMAYSESIQLVTQGTEVIMGLKYDPSTDLILATGGHVVPNQGWLWAIDPETNEVLYKASTSGGNPTFPGVDPNNNRVFVPDPAGHVDIFKIVI